MERIKGYLKEKQYLRYLAIYSAVIIVYHIFLREYGADTIAYFAKEMGGPFSFKRLFEILEFRYLTYTSRLLIEAPLFILTNGMHVVLWSVINIALHMIMFLSLMRLTGYRHNGLLLCLCLVYPFFDLYPSGWITAYINYFWPLALGTVAMVSLIRMYEGERISIPAGIFYLGCILFSCNLEIFAALYAGLLVLFFVIMVTQQRFTRNTLLFSVAQAIVCLADLLFILTCPGNWARKLMNIEVCFPDWDSLTVIDKAVMSINSSMAVFIDNNIFFAIFVFMLFALTIYVRKDDLKLQVMAGIPLAAVLMRTVFKQVSVSYFRDYTDLFDIYRGAARVDPTNYNNLASYLPFIIYMMILMCVFCVLINLFDCVHDGLVNAYILMIGIGTRLVLGFSPTVYFTGMRVFLLADYAMLYLIIRLFEEHHAELINNRLVYRSGKLFVFLLTIVSVCANLISVCFGYYYG